MQTSTAQNNQLDPNALTLTKAIGLQEGGGKVNYTQVGDGGTSAGAYQWNNGSKPLTPGQIPANFQSMAQQYGASTTDFSPENQNKVAYSHVKALLDSGLSPAQVASSWNAGSGEPNAYTGKFSNGNASTTPSFDVQGYVKGVQKYAQQLYGQQPQTQQQTPTTPEPAYSVGGFASNVVSSTGNLIGGLGNAIIHPLDTIGNLGNLVGGTLKAAANATGATNFQDPQVQTFNAMKDYFGKRYGGGSLQEIVSNIGNTLYKDPVGVALDLSTVLDGAGTALGAVGKIADVSKAAELAKASDFISTTSGILKSGDPAAIKALSSNGTMTRIANTMKTVADYTNPITAVIKTVSGATKLAGKYGAAPAIGLATGAGAENIRNFWGAVTEGGDTGKAATDALRGKYSPEDIVNLAKDSLGNIVDTRSTEYQKMLDTLKANTTPIKMGEGQTSIETELSKQLKDFNIKVGTDGTLDFGESTIGKPSDQNAIKNMYKDVTTWSDTTPRGLDILKQRLSSYWEPGSRVGAFSEGLRAKTRSFLETTPGYSPAMKQYADLTDQISEIKKGLSLGDKAMVETSFKKLTSAYRQNNEFRQTLIQALDQAGGGNLKSITAGQQLNSVLPRGLAKFGEYAGMAELIHGGVSIPLLVGMAASSPRLVGEFLKAMALPIKGLNTMEKILSKTVSPDTLDFIMRTAKLGVKAGVMNNRATSDARGQQ